MRRSTLLWSALAISVVIGLFAVKHRVQTLEDRLHALNTDIITDRDAIQVMEAEWSYLNQPARLEALSKRPARDERALRGADSVDPGTAGTVRAGRCRHGDTHRGRSQEKTSRPSCARSKAGGTPGI